MKNYLLYLILVIGMLGCGDEVNEDFGEYIEYTYFNDGNPTISDSPEAMSENISIGNSNAFDNGNDAIINIKGIKIQTDNDNYSITSFKVLEDKGAGFVQQSEFDSEDSSIKTDIASVLVLDMSTSLNEIINDLKSYAKDFATTITSSSENSKVAVVFFSSRDKISTTQFFESNELDELTQLIDNYNDFENKTALFQATNVGIDLLEGLTFDGEKSLVVFTDGGDNDSNNPSSQLNQIQNSEANIFTIGLKGNDFIENDIESIASSKSQHVVANSESDLQSIFREISLGVIAVYELVYARSNATLSQSESIKIRIECESMKIE